jgi:transcriptional regulator of met regulon
MVSQSGNLFSLQRYGDFGTWGRGKAYASGSYDFDASVHRGINFNGSIKFETSGGGHTKLMEAAGASFKVGGMGEAGLSLQAGFPLDLFKEAGVVACLKAQASASVFANLNLELDAAIFYEIVRHELLKSNSQWLDLVDIFFDEVVFEAGLWAKASASAGITAEAFMLGCLLDENPGFTFSVQYSAGFKYGAGLQFLSNIGLKNPQQLFNRLSDKMVYLIEDALTRHMSPDDSEAQKAMVYLKLFLPLASRAAFALGYDLVKSKPPNQQATAKTSIVQSFIAGVQELLVKSLFDLAMHELNRILEKEEFITKLEDLIDSMSVEKLDDIATIMVNLFDKLENMSIIGDATPEDWFNAVVELLDPLMEIMALDLFEDKDKESWQKNVAHCWATAVLVCHIIDRATSKDNGSKSAQFSEITVEIPVSIRNYLTEIEELPRNPNLSDLVSFILDEIDERIAILVSDAFPGQGELLQWLLGIFGVFNNSSLVQKLLEEPETLSPDVILNGLSDTMSDHEDKVFLTLDRLVMADSDLEIMINQVVKPILISIPVVVLDGIKNLDTEEKNRKLREQVSAVLLLILSRLLLTSTNVLIEEALVKGEAAVADLAQEVKKDPENDIFKIFETVNAITTMGASCLATPPSLSDNMKLTADVIKYWNKNKRENLFESMEKLIYLGLSTEGLEKVWNTLKTSDDPPMKGDLWELAERLMKDAWDLLVLITEETFAILSGAIWQCGEAAIAMIVTAVKWAVKGIKQGIDKLVEWIHELDEKLAKLKGDINDLLTVISGVINDLADKLSNILNDIIEEIRSKGLDYAKSVVGLEYVKSVVPKKIWKIVGLNKILGIVEKKVVKEYNNMFGEFETKLRSSLSSFTNLASWFNVELQEQLGSGKTLDNINLINSLKEEARKKRVPDLTIQVKVPLVIVPGIWKKTINFGTITVPGDLMLGRAVDFVFNKITNECNSLITNIVKKGNKLALTQREHDLYQASREDEISKQQALTEIDHTFTHSPLEVSIDTPVEANIYTNEVDLRVGISGANKTFVNSAIGVPNRVKVYINGTEYNYSGCNWVATDLSGSDGIELKATLTLRDAKNPVRSKNYDYSWRRGKFMCDFGQDFNYVFNPRSIRFSEHLPPYHEGVYQPKKQPVLQPGLNIVHVVVANGEENNEKSTQAVRMFYLT